MVAETACCTCRPPSCGTSLHWPVVLPLALLLELAATSAKTLKDKFLCSVKVGTLISLRSASANLKAFFAAEVQAELISEAARADLMHCKALDGWCVANDVHQELVAAADVLQEGYAAT